MLLPGGTFHSAPESSKCSHLMSGLPVFSCDSIQCGLPAGVITHVVLLIQGSNVKCLILHTQRRCSEDRVCVRARSLIALGLFGSSEYETLHLFCFALVHLVGCCRFRAEVVSRTNRSGVASVKWKWRLPGAIRSEVTDTLQPALDLQHITVTHVLL